MDITLDTSLPIDEAVGAFLEALDGSFPERTIPARDEAGDLIVPPEAHILDALVRQRMLINTDELWSHGLGTAAVMDELPECDACGDLARYDVISPLPACWACEDCYRGDTLGMGKAQRLLTYDEVPADVREICDRLTEAAGRESVFDEGEDDADDDEAE